MGDEEQDQGLGPEHARFYRLDHSWSFDGEDHVISVAAYKLHLDGTADSVKDGPPTVRSGWRGPGGPSGRTGTRAALQGWRGLGGTGLGGTWS
jgi:hypothetical protein